MNDWKQKLKMRLPAILLLAATLLFWGFYDRYERVGPVLLQAPALADATRVRGDCTETNGRFFLNVPSGGKSAGINFRLPDATGCKQIRVRGRIKVEGVVVGKHPWRCARLLLIQYDKNNKWIPGQHGVVSEQGTHGWTACEDVFDLDPRAAHADLVIEQTGVAGSAEFDRLVAEPVRLRASFDRWRVAFACLWILMGVLYFRRCRLHRRKLRLLILLNAIAIVFGTLMPEKWIEDTTDYVKEETVKVVAKAEPRPASVAPPRKHPEKNADQQEKIDRFNKMVGGVHGLGHFLLFALLCFLVYLSASLERQHRSYFLKVVFDILLFAAVTESLQHLTLDRTPGISDWLTDAYGLGTALLLFLVVELGIVARLRRTSDSSS